MSLKTFRIEFDRPGATYAPGEIVSGNVIADVSKDKNIRGLEVIAKGETEVHWVEHGTKKDSTGRSQTQNENYNNSEKYFNLNYTLLGGHGANADVKIPAGHHRFPFSFQLPNNIPSSFEHEFGHTRYTIKAVMDRPWKFDHECTAAFTVVSSLDLNNHQQKCIGIEDEQLENFYCFPLCYTTGMIKACVRLPSSGYVPGQSIETTVSFHNSSSSVRVTHLCTKLERYLQFHARSSVKKDNSEIKATKNLGPFNNNEEVVLRLQIPPIPPTSLESCNIIKLEYKLKVCIHVSGFHCSIVRYYPILIGTIPLHCMPSAPVLARVEESSTLPTSSLIPQMPNNPVPMPMPISGNTPMPMPVMPMPMPHPSNTYPGNPLATGDSSNPIQPAQPIGFVMAGQDQWQMPPPSYEECTSRTEHIKDYNESNYVHGANEPFAPRYPVFNVPTPHLPSK